MYRNIIAAFLFLAGCRSLDSSKIFPDDFQERRDQITGVIEIKVSNSVKSLKGNLVYPRSTQMDGSLRTVAIKDWTSGFFPGVLWYTLELTNNDEFKNSAEKWTEGLSPIQFYTGSHDIGFMINCSFGNGYRLTKNEEYHTVLLQAANTLMKRYKPAVGAIRSWDHGTDKWQYPVIIDNMMNLELLFWASKNGGTRQMYDLALQHAEKTMANSFRPDGSTFHVINYDSANGNVLSKETHQGFANSSCWARGQSWAIYGFTMAYRFTKSEKFLETAQKAADYFITHLPADKVPYWDFNAPNIPDEPRDASAAAIAASALLELGTYGDDPILKKKYYSEGIAILQSLFSPYYFNENSKSLGLLNHAVGNKPKNDEVNVSMIYGDYYFLEGLIRSKNYENKFADK